MNKLLGQVLGESGDPIVQTPNAKQTGSSTKGDPMMNVNDLMNFAISAGGDLMKKPEGRVLYNTLRYHFGDKPAQDVMDSLYLFDKRDDVKGMSPEQKIDTYFTLYSDNKNVTDLKQKMNVIGGLGKPSAKFRDYPGKYVPGFGVSDGLAKMVTK
jgi:hypothetical protein